LSGLTVELPDGASVTNPKLDDVLFQASFGRPLTSPPLKSPLTSPAAGRRHTATVVVKTTSDVIAYSEDIAPRMN